MCVCVCLYYINIPKFPEHLHLFCSYGGSELKVSIMYAKSLTSSVKLEIFVQIFQFDKNKSIFVKNVRIVI